MILATLYRKLRRAISYFASIYIPSFGTRTSSVPSHAMLSLAVSSAAEEPHRNESTFIFGIRRNIELKNHKYKHWVVLCQGFLWVDMVEYSNIFLCKPYVIGYIDQQNISKGLFLRSYDRTGEAFCSKHPLQSQIAMPSYVAVGTSLWCGGSCEVARSYLPDCMMWYVEKHTHRHSSIPINKRISLLFRSCAELGL